MKNPIILASSSPRRQELLKLLTDDFLVVPSTVEEVIDVRLSPIDVATELARIKAEDVAQAYSNHIVIGCDTVVIIDNEIIGKPKNASHAFDILSKLSNKTHQVITGCAVVYMNKTHVIYGLAEVTFKPLTSEEINAYILTKEPFGKAGAYAIQGYAAKFVEHINGDYYSIMGLPVAKLYAYLKEHIQ